MPLLTTRQRFKFSQIALPIALFFYTGAMLNPVFAANKWHDHEELEKAVHDYVSKKIEVPASNYTISLSHIDSRLKLVRCSQPITVFSPSANPLSGRITVGVRCTGIKPWKIYIPIQITRFAQIIVAKQPLLKGQILDADSISYARHKLSSSTQVYFFDNKHVVGKILNRSLSTGMPIKGNNLRAANLVKRGQEVILVAVTASIQVRMSGKALANGAKGDLIRVRNVKTRKIVEGIVTKAGTVKVIM